MMSKFEQLIEEIHKSCNEACQSWEELEQKLSNLQSEVTSAQEKASQELVQRISKSSYQFQQKGYKRQFNFNFSVQKSIVTARNESAKMVPADKREKEVLKKLWILWMKVPKPYLQGKNISNLQTIQNTAGPQ